MEVKDLIEIINIFEAKVIFDNPKDYAEHMMNSGLSPLYFIPFNEKEENKYNSSQKKSEFVSSTAAIHIVELTIPELINIYECDGTGAYELITEIINPYCTSDIPKEIVFISFIFLHEIGHWNQFISMNKNVEQFINKDLNLNKENFEKVQRIRIQRQERFERGNFCLLTSNKKKLLYQYMLEYRQIPKENDADQFALKNINLVLEKYKNRNINKK